MQTIEEAWVKISDANQPAGLIGHTFHGPGHESARCEHCNDIRALALASAEAAAACPSYDEYKALRAEIEALGR